MRKNFLVFLVIFLISLEGMGQVRGKVPFMPLEQVKAGMKGTGKSAFQGGKVEDFSVEILGVLRNFQPKKSLILAKLSGGVINDAGVISGMSGSPVYIEGKLIGAVAYNFPYSKEAIAGITPIEDMLSVSGEKQEIRSQVSRAIPVRKQLSLEDLFELHKDFFSAKTANFSEGQAFIPLNIPLVFNGFAPDAFEKAKPFFSKLGFSPVRTGSLTGQSKSLDAAEYSFKAGDPVGVQLVEGDLSVSAIGTVTYVDGNKILAFGHPMYNLGSVDYAMTKAEVLTVVPSISSSFKIANTGATVGRFSQDRSSGVFGEIGKMPRFLPLNIRLFRGEEEARELSLKVVNDKILAPLYLNVALSGILTEGERSYGDLSLELRGTIYLENGTNINLEDFYSGNFNNPVTSLSNLVAAIVYFLNNNEFEELSIHRIDLAVRTQEEARFAYLERVWLDRYEGHPGEMIRIKIYSRTFRGESVESEVGIPVPNLPAGSEFHLLIGDSDSMSKMEMSLYRSTGFIPRSLSQLLRTLNNLRKNNRIYFKILTSKPGLFLKGEEMPNLPLTLKSMFSSPRASASAPVELTKSTLREYQLPVPYVYQGSALIPLKVRK